MTYKIINPLPIVFCMSVCSCVTLFIHKQINRTHIIENSLRVIVNACNVIIFEVIMVYILRFFKTLIIYFHKHVCYYGEIEFRADLVVFPHFHSMQVIY